MRKLAELDKAPVGVRDSLRYAALTDLYRADRPYLTTQQHFLLPFTIVSLDIDALYSDLFRSGYFPKPRAGHDHFKNLTIA